MSLHDFTMTLHSTQTLVGGVGLVAVDLAHKKEKVCKELIEFFLQHYRKKGACMTALYPFRPDFYRKMGFGYGTKVSLYKIKPGDLPRGKSRGHIQLLDKSDLRAIVNCYDRYAKRTHGMMKKCAYEFGRYEKSITRIAGYKSGKRLLGYVAFTFKPLKPGNFILNDLRVEELIYENRDVLSELLTFLHTQADQINRILIYTEDDDFHFLPHDPRDGSDELLVPLYHQSSVQGVGIMYRVIDTVGLFEVLKNHSFGDQTCKLKISITDSFCRENQGSCIVHFRDGRPRIKKSARFDVEIRLDVSDFSSLVMGTADFESLFTYGLVEISDDKYVGAVRKLFLTDHKPVCTTQF
jgi:predicted acetyltransferase